MKYTAPWVSLLLALFASCASTIDGVADDTQTSVPEISGSVISGIPDDVLTRYAEQGVILDLPEGAYLVPQVEQQDAYYDVAFALPDREIEFRLALYSPEFALGGGDMALEQQLGMTMMLIVLNISQEMIGESSFQQFPYEVVNREFGADFGVTGLVEGRSDFSKGWRYVLVEGFIREGRGTVIKYALFNDPDVLFDGVMGADAAIFDAYYCFWYDD
jgi:hypothetical protein